MLNGLFNDTINWQDHIATGSIKELVNFGGMILTW